MNRLMTLLAIPLLFLAIAGCLGTSGTAGEPSLADATTEPQLTPTPLDPDDPFVRDATSFAEHEGLSLEEAVRRLEFQETIGAIQPELEADLPDSYAGLWVEHQPQYRIVIVQSHRPLDHVDVVTDVGVTQQHSLGHSGRTAGEDHR